MDNRPITEQLRFWEPEDVWEGAYNKGIQLPDELSSLRQKLYQKAKLEPKFRFYSLYDRIYRWDVLSSAYRIVKRNNGAPGIDGINFKTIEKGAGGVEGFLKELQESLKTKSYKPEGVCRVWIPKPDGRKRPLGIPTIRDRVTQMAVLLVIEPIFEADFMDCSYGFRPGRSAHDALSDIAGTIKEGLTALYDADLKGYFDSIPHDKLISCLRMRIVDRSVLKLVRMWLQAPIIEEDGKGGRKISRSRKGTPQGGVISPLLANIYLHWFEKVFHYASGPGTWANARIVRYADDFVVHARYIGSRINEYIEAKLETWLGLELNREKTKVVDLSQTGASVDFLGFTFRYDRDLRGRRKRYLNITPSEKAMRARREAIRKMIGCHQSHIPVKCLIEQVNLQLKGWSLYFSFGYPRKAMRKVNWYVRNRLIRQLRRRSQRPYRPPKGQSYYQHLKDLGLIYL